MGVRLTGTAIAATLANADVRARTEGDELLSTSLALAWLPGIEALLDPKAPKTYIVVLATTVTARAMFETDALDVRAIQAGYSDRAYAAASIAKQVATFAKEHQIDLRATSSQPMNNHPFTFKAYLDPTWEVNPRGAAAWARFNDLVDQVQNLTSEQASLLLAIIFERCRRQDNAALSLSLHGGRAIYDEVIDAVCRFVDTTASNGRIGQAFVAALLDTVYEPSKVLLGALHDPDVSRPGDVHVGESTIWLWAEVKQKVIETGHIEGFISKVSQAGGDRIAYFALANSTYGDNLIKRRSVDRHARRLGTQVHVVTSSQEAADWVLSLAHGPLAAIATTVLERLHARMTEAGCSAEEIRLLEQLAARF